MKSIARFAITGVFLALIIGLTGEGTVLAQDGATLEAADFLDFEQVADPQVSPDGRSVIYTRRWIDQQADEWASALWMVNSDGTRNRFLVEGSNARWSPDGQRILFIAKGDNDKPQVFVRWMDAEGAVSQVTRLTHRPHAPKWSPDASQIAFVAIVPSKVKWDIPMPAPPEGAKWTAAPRLVDRLHYRQDRVGYTEPGFSHLFVVSSDAGTPRQLTEGEWHVGAQFDGLFNGAGYNWMPDGSAIVFDGFDDPDGDFSYRRSDIYSVDVGSRELTTLTSEPGFWVAPNVSGDGRRIAYVGFGVSTGSYEMPRLFIMDSDGGSARLLAGDFDREPAVALIWSPDDRGVYFTAQDEGYQQVFFTSTDGETRAVTSGKHVVNLRSASRDGSVAVGIRRTSTEPGDVFSFALNGDGEHHQLTSVNSDLLADKQLGAHEEIWFESADGTRVHGWVVKPPDFDATKSYPLLFEIHGGPFAAYDGRFNFRNQTFAANGFVVLYTNPRGSTGYGEEFSQGIDHAYPSVDYDDLMAGVDAVIDAGSIDTNRLYVGGCSGGGILSSWVIGHTTRFAAAAVRCPVTNWMSMAGQTDIPYFTHSFFEKPFWEDPERWLHYSPVMYVGNVTTPTLIMTGVRDLRTPMPQSEEYYAALKMRGVPTKLLRFNDEFHGTGSKPSNAMRTMLYMMSWYNEHSLGDDSETEPGPNN